LWCSGVVDAGAAFSGKSGFAIQDLARLLLDYTSPMTFDESYPAVPAPITPQQIRKLRERHRVGPKPFASYLNTCTSSVNKWESGVRRPGPFARKLLAIVEKHGLEMLA
jgi:putative transcriptional regulator